MLANFLFNLTAILPCKLIPIEGRPYMERYFVCAIPTPWGRVPVYLHRYVGADGDRKVHNHPWPWALGIVLCGRIWELVMRALCPDTGPILELRTLRRFRPNRIGGDRFHQIVGVAPNTWTLFAHAPWQPGRSWGFVDFVKGLGVLFHRDRPASDAPNEWWLDPACPTGETAGREPWSELTGLNQRPQTDTAPYALAMYAAVHLSPAPARRPALLKEQHAHPHIEAHDAATRVA